MNFNTNLNNKDALRYPPLSEYLFNNSQIWVYHWVLDNWSTKMWGRVHDQNNTSDILSFFGSPKSETNQFYWNENSALQTRDEKLVYAIKNRPHIACTIHKISETQNLRSPIWLIVKSWFVTDLWDISKVDNKWTRKIIWSSENKLMEILWKLKNHQNHAEINIKKPEFSAIYVDTSHNYVKENPSIYTKLKKIAQEHWLQIIEL